MIEVTDKHFGAVIVATVKPKGYKWDSYKTWYFPRFVGTKEDAIPLIENMGYEDVRVQYVWPVVYKSSKFKHIKASVDVDCDTTNAKPYRAGHRIPKSTFSGIVVYQGGSSYALYRASLNQVCYTSQPKCWFEENGIWKRVDISYHNPGEIRSWISLDAYLDFADIRGTESDYVEQALQARLDKYYIGLSKQLDIARGQTEWEKRK